MTRYAGFIQAIRTANAKEGQTAITITDTNLAMLLRLREQYARIFRNAGDDEALAWVESATPNDLISLLHAGFSEVSLDKSAGEVMERV